VNEYEKQRATLLAELGYVAFAADIYGADLQENLDFETRLNLTGTYRGNPTLYVQRIARAIEVAQGLPGADPDNVAVIGYCFGGTGILYLAISGNDQAKVVVSFHGGLSDIPEIDSPVATSALETDVMTPYVLM